MIDNALLLLYSAVRHASEADRPHLLASQVFAKKLLEAEGISGSGSMPSSFYSHAYQQMVSFLGEQQFPASQKKGSGSFSSQRFFIGTADSKPIMESAAMTSTGERGDFVVGGDRGTRAALMTTSCPGLSVPETVYGI